MNTGYPFDGSTRSGTIGGTLLVLLLQLGRAEVVKTMVLAAIGATVSFGVSFFLKWVLQRLKNRGRGRS